jgi:hypothetical protein
LTQLTDDTPADRLHHLGNVSIAGRLALDKARLEACLGALEIDAFKKDTMKMDIQIDGATEAQYDCSWCWTSAAGSLIDEDWAHRRDGTCSAWLRSKAC